MVKEQIIDFLRDNKFVAGQALYVVVCACFLVSLGLYNAELADRFGTLALGDLQTRGFDTIVKAGDILEYQGYSALYYFVFGVALCLAGVAFVVVVVKGYRSRPCYDRRLSSLIASVACVVATLVLIVLILAFLNNPILVAVIIAALGVGSLYATTS